MLGLPGGQPASSALARLARTGCGRHRRTLCERFYTDGVPGYGSHFERSAKLRRAFGEPLAVIRLRIHQAELRAL